MSDPGQRARRRIAYRLLPFVFLIYIVNYIDRVNVSFANLRMSADLGFSDRVYGLGVAIFYASYVLFEIPGAIIVERWSARKWMARIMISWGLITILTGFVRSAGQFYAARFILGVAESSFFPGMIVYLTHWFRQRERSRAIACLYAAVPAASLIGSPVAGWLLGVHWWGMAGWRWLFVLEGTPAIVLGVITVFYLTDWPAQARWLPQDEREWLVHELQAELQAKKRIRNYTIVEAFCDRRILGLMATWFLALTGALGTIYWIPTFVKRLAGFSDRTVTSLLLIPGSDGHRRDAHQQLALRQDGRAVLAYRDSAHHCGIDVRAPDLRPPRSTSGDFVLTSGQRVLVRVLPDVLGDTDDDAERIGGRRHLRTNQFDGATRGICRKLRDWSPERSHSLAHRQFRIHRASLFRGRKPDSLSANPQSPRGFAAVEPARR